MADIDFRLTGLDELVRTLHELNEVSALKVGNSAAQQGAKLIREEFKASAPVGTEPTSKTRTITKGKKKGTVIRYDYGHLRDNIRVRKRKAERQHQVRYAVGIGSAFWGLMYEFGSRHQAARPWLRPAFDRVGPRVVEEVGTILGTGIMREGKRLARLGRKLGIR